MDYNSKLNIPSEVLRYIEPGPRKAVLKNLVAAYGERFKNFTPLFVYLNHDAEKMYDYLIIMQSNHTSMSQKIIIFDFPPIFTERSLPGYRYCVKNGLKEDFFQEVEGRMVRLFYTKFVEFIESLRLTMNEKDEENYWLNKDKLPLVLEALFDLSLRYTPAIKKH